MVVSDEAKNWSKWKISMIVAKCLTVSPDSGEMFERPRVTDIILDINPVLESFGNTLRS